MVTPESLSRSGSEFGEQTALFCWANSREVREAFPELFNAENGKCKLFATFQNFHDPVKGARAKQAGVSSGVADLFLPLARHGVHGLFVEMKVNPAKVKRPGRLAPEQLAFSRQVQADGFGYAKAEGWEEAREIILQYLS